MPPSQTFNLTLDSSINIYEHCRARTAWHAASPLGASADIDDYKNNDTLFNASSSEISDDAEVQAFLSSHALV